tara:strand:+ start:133 stop:309 length:177 start_codon:yes stop_codon:yes gene_type:complete
MEKLFKPSSKLLVWFLLLPITPSIAAITVFTQSLLIDRNNEVLILPEHSKRVLDASRY